MPGVLAPLTLLDCEDGYGGHYGIVLDRRTGLMTPTLRVIPASTWLANRHILGLPEDRRHGRIAPRNPAARLILANGVNLACHVIDISQSGAAVATNLRPELGAPVTIGRTPGRVVRHLDDGIAIEFTRLQHPDFLEDGITGE